MDRPEIAGKHKNPATQVWATTAFANPIWARPAAAGRKILPAPASRRPPPPWMAHVQ